MTTTTTTPKNSNALAARIEKLAPQIRKIAAGMARDAMHADDLFQAGAIRILNTCADFDSDARMLMHARSAMRNEITMECRYTLRVDSFEDNQVGSSKSKDEESDDDAFGQYKVQGQKTPEESVIEIETLEKIQEVILTLSPENQNIIRLLSVGKRQADIARGLGVSRATVCVRVGQIAGALTASGLSLSFS